MKKIFFACIIAVVLLITGFSGCINEEKKANATIHPFLWKIEGNPPSYIFGTYHLSTKDILTIPSVVIDAIKDIDDVYSEMDISAYSANQSQSSTLIFLPNNRTIDDFLENDTLDQIHNLFENSGLDISKIERLKLPWLATMVDAVSSAKGGTIQQLPQLDYYLLFQAYIRGKTSLELETASELNNIIDNMTLPDQKEYLHYVLNRTGNNDNHNWQEIYINGDLNAVYTQMLDSLGEVGYRYFGAQRNELMAKKIENILTNHTGHRTLFMVGVGHLCGEEGLISLLTKEGYQITRVEFPQSETCENSYTTINGRCYKEFDYSAYNNTIANYHQGASFFSQGKYEEAISKYSEVLQFEPQHFLAAFYRGISYLHTGQYHEALDDFNTSLVIYPRYADAWLYKGNVLFSFNQYNESKDACEQALILHPNYTEALIGISWSLMSMERYNESLESSIRAKETNTNSSSAWYTLATNYYHLNQFIDALNAYTNATTIDPQFALAWYYKGFSLKKLGRSDEANQAFIRAHGLDPKLDIP